MPGCTHIDRNKRKISKKSQCTVNQSLLKVLIVHESIQKVLHDEKIIFFINECKVYKIYDVLFTSTTNKNETIWFFDLDKLTPF